MKKKSIIFTIICILTLFIVIISIVIGIKRTKTTVPTSGSAKKQHEKIVPDTPSEHNITKTDSTTTDDTTKTDDTTTHSESNLKTAPHSTEPVLTPAKQGKVPTASTPEPTESKPDTVIPAAPAIEPTVPNKTASMDKYTSQGLRYWLYTPENPSDNMPLIVYLHGSSCKGDNLDQLLDIDGFPKWLYDGQIGKPSAYILIPQLSSTQKEWNDIGSSLITLIDEVAANYKIDTNNISLTGHSMGGTGTLMLAKAYPDTFSRIAPCSGSIRITNDDLTIFQNMAVWAFVGSEDTIVDPKSSIYFVNKLSEIGNARLTQFDGATHFDVPALVYLNNKINIIDWLING